MQRYNNQARTSTGDVVANPTITVYNSGTLNLSSIFSDNGVTVLANPFTGSTNGQFYFYAANGVYDIVVTGGTPDIGTLTISGERLEDDTGIVSGTQGITSLNGLLGSAQPAQLAVTGTSGNDFNIVSAVATHTFNLPVASSTKNGKLQSIDWLNFNNKIGNLNGLTGTAQSFSVGSSGNDATIVSSGTVHTFNFPSSSTSKRGLLAASDFTTFSNKQNALPVGTNLQYLRGDLVLATLNTAVVPELTNLYYTDARARLSISGNAPLSYNNATGVMSIPAATGSQNGYLSSTDWTTFNNKIGSVNGLSDVTQTFAVGTTGTDFAVVSAAGVHTFNLPSASGANRGVVTTGTQSIAGSKTFTSPVNETKDVDVMVVDATRFTATATVTKDTSVAELDVNSITLAGAPSVNRTYRIHLAGSVRVSTGGTDTFRIRVYLGGSAVIDTGAIDPVLTTAFNYDGWFDLVVRTAGGAGVVQANGVFHFDDSTFVHKVIDTNTAAVVLTGSPILKSTVQFSVSNATNQLKEEVFCVQVLN